MIAWYIHNTNGTIREQSPGHDESSISL